MQKIAWDLETKKGYTVIQCTYGQNGEAASEDALNNLIAAHHKKIELCDAVYIVDINGYIGKSVHSELIYAQQLGKEIIFHSHQSESNAIFQT